MAANQGCNFANRRGPEGGSKVLARIRGGVSLARDVMKVWRFILVVWLLGGTLPLGAADAKTEFTDLNGQVRQPLATTGHKATVFIFTWQTCPVANAYAPEIERIYQNYKERGVALFVIQVDPELKPDQARQHAKEYGYTMPLLHDPKGVLAKHTGATMTPEAVVLLPDGKRIYNGRIDNRQAALGKRRPKATVFDLRDTLDAVLAGKELKPRTTEVIGCYIPEG